MSNIKVAKDAIKAELKTAREGVAFYRARVASLEEALGRLDIVDAPTSEPTKRRGRKAAESTPQKSAASKGRKVAGAKKSSEAQLPATGKEFWLGLAGQEPRSSSEIYEAAIQALGISPSKDQSKKLAQRQANALSVLCKSGALSSSGAGRDRRYFK